MTTDRVLAIIGIVIGIPAFLTLFLNAQWTQGTLVLMFVLAVIGYQAYIFHRDRQPMFTILTILKEVTIHDVEGKTAICKRFQEMRTNRKGVTEFWFRNLAQDGSISNILIDGRLPDEQIVSAGTTQVCRKFNRELEKGEKLPMDLTYTLTDSFTARKESIVHVAALKANKVTLVAILPKPCISTELYVTYSGQQSKLLIAPAISTDRRRLESTIKKPRLGTHYHLEWTW